MTRSFTPEINALRALSGDLAEELEQVAADAYQLPPNEADKQSELLLQPAGVGQKIANLRAKLRNYSPTQHERHVAASRSSVRMTKMMPLTIWRNRFCSAARRLY